MSFDPKNSNSANNPDNPNNPNLNPGGGLPSSGSQSSSGRQSILTGQPNTQLLNAMEQQLISVQNGQFRNDQIQFAQKQIAQKMGDLLYYQGLYNRYIQDQNVGERDKNEVKTAIDRLKNEINNLSKSLTGSIQEITEEQINKDDFRRKNEALDHLVNQSQNRGAVMDAAAYITYIFENMSKNRDFDPVITSQICDEIVKQFEEKMKAQGQVGLISQYADWIRSYVTDTIGVAKISYLRTKALIEPTGQAAAGLTMIGLAATNLDPTLMYVEPTIRGFGPALVRDESLIMTGLGNIARTLSTTTTNTLIAATNLVTRAISSHPVAATFAGLSLLLSAYWKLSPNQRIQVSETMNQLLEKLQEIWNKATDKDTWIPAYNQVCSLMVKLKDYLEDIGVFVIDDTYDDICSVHSDPSTSSSASSSASSGVPPLKIPSSVSLSSSSTISSPLFGPNVPRKRQLSKLSTSTQVTKTSTKASTIADTLSLDLFKNTGQQLVIQNLERFQKLINEESSSSASSTSDMPTFVNIPSRTISNISDITVSPSESQEMDLGIEGPVGYERANSRDSGSSSGSQGPPPGVITEDIISETTPLLERRSEKRGYMSSNVEDVKGEKKVKTDEPEPTSSSSSQSSDMYAGLGGSYRSIRHKSRRHKSRRYTKKRKVIRRRRNTRRRPKRHTKRYYRK
jgi:hypothetical protein